MAQAQILACATDCEPAHSGGGGGGGACLRMRLTAAA